MTSRAPGNRGGRWLGSSSSRSEQKYEASQRVLFLQRMVMTVAALGLFGTLLWVFFDTKPAVPLITAVITDYAEPLGPLALAAADRERLTELSAGRSSLRRGTVRPVDLSADVREADAERLRATLARQLGGVRGGGPHDAAILYITAIGAVNRDGKACLVPPRLPPVATAESDRSWLRVTDLLDELAGVEKRPRTVLVILDACRPAHGTAYGILDGGFAAAVEADLRSGSQPGIFVVCAAGSGETSCAGATETASVFAGAFIDGVEGCADADQNGRVSVAELGAYLEGEVARRALLRHGRRQTAFLVASAKERDDAGRWVSWTVRREPRSWGDAEVNGPDSEAATWLTGRWRQAESLRDRAILEHPESWSRLEHLLVRAERLHADGGPVDARTWQKIRDDVETLLEDRLGQSLLGDGALPGLRLSSLASLAPGSDSTTGSEGDPVWRSQLDAWRRQVPDQEPARSELPPPRDAAEWSARATDAWQAVVERVRSGEPPDLSSWQRWQQLPGMPPGGTGAPAAFEWQVAKLLVRWGDREAWAREPGAMARVITLTQGAVEAALPTDVRADAVLDAIAPRQKTDRARREAFDLAVVGDERSLARAALLADTAAGEYSGIARQGEELSAAWRLLDLVRAELPWLAAWRASLETVAGRAADVTLPGGNAWEELVMQADRLERLLSARESPSTARIAPVVTAIKPVFRGLRDEYEAACDRLADPSAGNATSLAEIRCVLAVPLVTGERRERLRERERQLTGSLRQDGAERVTARDGPPVAAATASDGGAVGWVRWQQGWIEPVVAALAPAASPAPQPRSSADIAAAYGSWGQLLRETMGLRSENEGGDSTAAVSEAAAVARRLAVPRGSFADGIPGEAVGGSVAGTHLRRCWRERLLRFAGDMLDEFLGGCERDDPVWFIEAARVCLAKAERLPAVGDDDDAWHERVTVRLGALESVRDGWAELENDPDRIGGGGNLGSAPVRSTLRIAADVARYVPVGVAATWLSPGSVDESLWLATAVDGNEKTRRVALPVARPDASGNPLDLTWRVDPESAGRLQADGRGVLDLTAWFRGNTRLAPLRVAADGAGAPIVWRRGRVVPARITVEGREKRSGHVSFVFDYSGSMRKATAGGQTRYEVGRRAFGEILDSLAEVGSWHVSLSLYGHRLGWTREKPYQPNPSPAEQRARQAGRGAPALQPGDDVEEILAMRLLNRRNARDVQGSLQGLQGWGETPLYLAIKRVLERDQRVVPPGEFWRVIVVTDGVNDQLRPPFTTAKDVSDALAAVNRGRTNPVRVDVIALDFGRAQLESDDQRREYDAMKELVAKSGGQWRDANDIARLKQSFREFLQLVRWEALDAAGRSVGQKEFGDFLEVDPGSYTVRIEGREPTGTKLDLDGGEGVRLFAPPGGGPLEHERYDGGTEQGFRGEPQAGLTDPADAPRMWFVAAHLPRREGGGVRFPVSIQNDDAKAFAPRPVEFWAEVRPAGVAGASPFVFVDTVFQDNRPVPVVELVVPSWPADATAAEILLWFSARPIEPRAMVQLDALDVGVARPFRFPDVPGVVLETRLDTIDDSSARVTVIERHQNQRDLPRLRLRVERPGHAASCTRVEHVVDESAGTVSHVFDLELEAGKIPPGTRLSIVGRDELKEHCVKPAAPGGRIQPFRVPVPAD